ncbi:hypothetical protein Ancab_000669 [Ancistrocladus abbreviatus]
MAVKREVGGGVSDTAQIPTHAQKRRFKFRKVVKYVMKEAFLEDLVARLEPVLQRVVKQQLEQIVLHLQSSPKRCFVDQPESSGTRGFQLRFVNKLPSTLFTNSRIEAEGNAPVKIELIDANSNSVIRHPPLCSLRIEILVLNGDFVANGQEEWSEKEFNDNIVRERAGKRPLLVGELSLSLIQGAAFINNISFTDNSSWVRSRKFKLGIRVVPSASCGIGIKEAISDAFVVLDHRGESYQKHNTPALSDPVWRLKRIAKDGASHKRLAEREIHTVREFLQLYHANPLLLRDILGNGVANKAWDTIIKHASSCHLDSQLYMYCDAAKGVSLYFNCVYKVIAVTFDGENYQSVDTLNMHQTEQLEELKQFAYKNLNELIPIDGSSAICPSLPLSTHHTVPLYTPALDLLPNDVSMANPDEAESRQLGCYPLETSAFHPHLMEDVIQAEEESTTPQSSQLDQGVYPAALMSDSSTELLNGGYGWNPSSSMAAAASNCPFFGEETYPPTWHPPALQGDWMQATTALFPASSSSNTCIGFLSPLPHNGANISRIRKPKAGWCKIRAFVKLKIIRRHAARKKAKSSFHYCFEG